MNQIKYLITILFFHGLIAQGNFQILNIPSSTRLLSLSNSGHAYNSLINSHNPASVKINNKNFNLQSHFYPADIVYIKSELVLPLANKVYSFEYSNLNYGEFLDAWSNYSFNSSEFLFKGSMKMEVLNKFSIGGGLSYGINKISNQFAHALFLSLGARTQMINPYLGLGLAVNNIGIINKNFSNSKDDLPTSILVSTFYQPTYFPGVLFCDVYKQNMIDDIEVRLGLESTIHKYLILRFGYNSNTNQLIDSHSNYLKGISAGVGIVSKKWDIDIGFYNLETAGLISSISLIYKK